MSTMNETRPAKAALADEPSAALERLANLRLYGDGPDDYAPDGNEAVRILNWHIANARKAVAKYKEAGL